MTDRGRQWLRQLPSGPQLSAVRAKQSVRNSPAAPTAVMPWSGACIGDKQEFADRLPFYVVRYSVPWLGRTIIHSFIGRQKGLGKEGKGGQPL